VNRDTDRWVRSAEAQDKFRDLLDEAERGGYVYILRYDKPAAVLVNVEWFERARGEAGPEPEGNPGPRSVASADPLHPIMRRLAGLPPEEGRTDG
jgi:hypothetical protein